MTRSLDAARQVVQAQPWRRLPGAELVHFSGEDVARRVSLSWQLKQKHGFVHGGAISCAADNALTFAVASGPEPAVVTGEFKINDTR